MICSTMILPVRCSGPPGQDSVRVQTQGLMCANHIHSAMSCFLSPGAVPKISSESFLESEEGELCYLPATLF